MRTGAQGVCFHLYSRARSLGLAEFQVPELQRSPLDELCLQARPPLAQRGACPHENGSVDQRCCRLFLRGAGLVACPVASL